MDYEQFLKDPWDTPDWSREMPRGFWDPPRKLLRSIRDYQSAERPFRALKRKTAVLRHRFWSMVCSCDIPINCKIAGGFNLPHPVGIVIHPDSTIGPNCTLFQQVTLAGKCKLAGKVDVGAGARLLGVEIGKYVLIGANSVVTKPIPEYSVAKGIPASWTPIRRRIFRAGSARGCARERGKLSGAAPPEAYSQNPAHELKEI